MNRIVQSEQTHTTKKNEFCSRNQWQNTNFLVKFTKLSLNWLMTQMNKRKEDAIIHLFISIFSSLHRTMFNGVNREGKIKMKMTGPFEEKWICKTNNSKTHTFKKMASKCTNNSVSGAFNCHFKIPSPTASWLKNQMNGICTWQTSFVFQSINIKKKDWEKNNHFWKMENLWKVPGFKAANTIQAKITFALISISCLFYVDQNEQFMLIFSIPIWISILINRNCSTVNRMIRKYRLIP